jgi:uncharacterized phiE125 gp8 family phage protein
MYYSLVLNTGPIDEPITLNEAKSQLRVDTDFTADDTYIERLIKEARKQCEIESYWSTMTQTYDLYVDQWPSGDYFELPRPPLVAVDEITYTTFTGDPDSPTTLATSVYYVDTYKTPGRVYLKPNQEWPGDDLYPTSPIKITFQCGHNARGSIPGNLRNWMFKHITDNYENREPLLIGPGNTIVINPRWDHLLTSYRMMAKDWRYAD